MHIQKMSVQEFGNTLNNVTQQMESTQGKRSPIDVNSILKNIQDCNKFILENKNITLPENVNKNIEKFISAANLFILHCADKGSQEKMGSFIATLAPFTDDLQKLRESLRKRHISKSQRYGSKVEKVIKESREFKKK